MIPCQSRGRKARSKQRRPSFIWNENLPRAFNRFTDNFVNKWGDERHAEGCQLQTGPSYPTARGNFHVGPLHRNGDLHLPPRLARTRNTKSQGHFGSGTYYTSVCTDEKEKKKKRFFYISVDKRLNARQRLAQDECMNILKNGRHDRSRKMLASRTYMCAYAQDKRRVQRKRSGFYDTHLHKC